MKVSEAALENSRPRARTNCEPTIGLFRSAIVGPQSGSLACNGEGAIWPMPGCGDYSLLGDCWRSIAPGPFAMHQETSKSLETTSQVVLRRELITECWRTA